MHYLLTGRPPWLLQLELAKNKCTPERLEVWQRGVDTVRFNPSYKCEAMRSTLTDGHPEAPLLVHVGRLGAGVSQPTIYGLLECCTSNNLQAAHDLHSHIVMSAATPLTIRECIACLLSCVLHTFCTVLLCQ